MLLSTSASLTGGPPLENDGRKTQESSVRPGEPHRARVAGRKACWPNVAIGLWLLDGTDAACWAYPTAPQGSRMTQGLNLCRKRHQKKQHSKSTGKNLDLVERIMQAWRTRSLETSVGPILYEFCAARARAPELCG